MKRPSRKERGVPAAGKRRTCQRARVRRLLVAAGSMPRGAVTEVEAAHLHLQGTLGYAPQGSVSAALQDAANICQCRPCEEYLAGLHAAHANHHVLNRDSRSADRTGATARIGGGMSDDSIYLRGLEDQASQRGGMRAVKTWHARQREAAHANRIFDALRVDANDN